MLLKIYSFLFCIFFIFSSCTKEIKKQTKVETNTSEKITSVTKYNYKQLKPLLHQKSDKTYVVNFWATWCAPCVKELPYFERIHKEYGNKNVEVLLVSLDFPKKIESKLIPFINRKKIQSKVVVLDDVNENFWIADINKNWSGALPATIIYNQNQRKFYEQSFDFKTLQTELQTFLKP